MHKNLKIFKNLASKAPDKLLLILYHIIIFYISTICSIIIVFFQHFPNSQFLEYPTPENIYYVVYLLKYLIKSSIESRKGTGKMHDKPMIQLEYYINDCETPSSLTLQTEIESFMNHVANNIAIGPIFLNEDKSSNEKVMKNEIKNQFDVFKKNLMNNFINMLDLTSLND